MLFVSLESCKVKSGNNLFFFDSLINLINSCFYLLYIVFGCTLKWVCHADVV